jgi:hypothetical protein
MKNLTILLQLHVEKHLMICSEKRFLSEVIARKRWITACSGRFLFRLFVFGTAGRTAFAETAAPNFAFFSLLVASTHVLLLAAAGRIL